METELIGGINAVGESLRRQGLKVHTLYCREAPGRRLKEILDQARGRQVTVKLVPAATLDRLLPGVRHQGVVAQVTPFSFTHFSELLQLAVKRPQFRLLALDGVTDPRNFGAIIRSAAAAGVDGLLLPERRCAPINAQVGKSAAGALASLPICRIGNLVAILERLKEDGFWIYGAAAAGGTELYDVDWAAKSVLVLGSEDRGLRPLVARSCDLEVTIPLAAESESLNVGIAAAVILFEQNRFFRSSRSDFAARSTPCRERDT